ncbi:MAG: histidine kinase, partial [Firmicutes bacterium]|nr:histidine kinase [Bacillota bacterium]
VLLNTFEDQIFTELESEAKYISHAIKNEGAGYIDNFNGDERRITLIASDGNVIADTAADTSSLDNHSDREEIIEAMIKGEASTSRYSDTLMEKTLYYAVKLENGDVLRVSTTRESVIALALELIIPMLFIIMIALAASIIISRKVSGAIVKPINELNLEYPEKNETYEELTPLLRKISLQKKTISEQIKEAKQKQAEFDLITKNMDEGLLIIDRNASVLSYNNAVTKLIDINGISSRSVLAFNRTKGFREAVESALKGNKAEVYINSEERVFNIIGDPVFQGDNIIGAVIIIIDVTERVRNEQLRREFTSNVSHELRTPLTSISGFAELMKNGGYPDEVVKDFSSSIYEEAQRLISLVNDIMKISAMDEAQGVYEKETVDLYALSKEIVGRLEAVAAKKSVSFDIKGESTFVEGSGKIIDEMIYNLCDNAIKYNKEGGHVEILTETKGSNSLITVKDTGIGIPFAYQDRVFERFYRIDKSHSKNIEGSGLGLAIVKHGAAYHDADISLDSVEGEGTIITVKFKKQN